MVDRRPPLSEARPRKKLGPGLRLLAALAVLVAFAIALFGVWVGTSLAIYKDGPLWLVIVGAVLCFGIVPLAWELWADRHQRGGRVQDTILRSAFLSLAFLVVLLATHPKTAFEALATRGDWFLGDARGGPADDVRRFLHSAANGLEWLNDLVREKAFRLPKDDPDRVASERAQPVPPSVAPTVAQPEPAEAEDVAPSTFPIAGSVAGWPLPDAIHPAVLAMPDSEKTSVESVGRYLRDHVSDPLGRVRAIHDFVATWVDYDAAGLADGSYKDRPNDAASVFQRRTSVCEGYARLATALGKVTGDEVVFVSGDARKASDYSDLPSLDALPASDVGHAWNAAKVGDGWLLFDATWDAGSVSGTTFTREYRTVYLFTPPEVFAVDHRPDDDRYQLLAAPLDRGAWLRQPLYRPRAFSYGLRLVAPEGPMTTASGKLSLTVDNPKRSFVWLGLNREGTGHIDCGEPSNAARAVLECPITEAGRAEAVLFVAPRRYTTYETALSLIVDGTPP